MAVTSQLRPAPALGKVRISDWQPAGLLKPSAIKPVFATIEQRLIIPSFANSACSKRQIWPRSGKLSKKRSDRRERRSSLLLHVWLQAV
jgi:hypothetical protein